MDNQELPIERFIEIGEIFQSALHRAFQSDASSFEELQLALNQEIGREYLLRYVAIPPPNFWDDYALFLKQYRELLGQNEL